MPVVAAQLIRDYKTPLYQVEPTESPSDDEDIAEINGVGYAVEDTAIGWLPYTHIIAVHTGERYLARLV